MPGRPQSWADLPRDGRVSLFPLSQHLIDVGLAVAPQGHCVQVRLGVLWLLVQPPQSPALSPPQVEMGGLALGPPAVCIGIQYRLLRSALS